MEHAAMTHENKFLNRLKRAYITNDFVMKPIQINEKKRKSINELKSIHINKIQRSKFIEMDADFLNEKDCLNRQVVTNT